MKGVLCLEGFFFWGDLVVRVIKKLNNNFAICVDGDGEEFIAYGKGIGFPKIPYELTDPTLIDRRFYDVDQQYLALFNELPEKVLHFTVKLVDIAKNELDYELNPNIVLTLADHINFCIQRAKQHIYVQMPLIYEVEQQYPQEGKLGRYALKQIERRFAMQLNQNEASGIAIHFVNARYNVKTRRDVNAQWQQRYDDVLEDTVSLIEDEMGIVINRSSFNFARYSSYLMYLLQRLGTGSVLDSNISDMYCSLGEERPQIARCVELIGEYFHDKWGCSLCEEEKLYLLLHINRICTREGL